MTAHPIPAKVKAALASALADYKSAIDPTTRPGQEWVTAGELANAWGMSLNHARRAASLSIKRGRMERTKRGKVVYYRAAP